MLSVTGFFYRTIHKLYSTLLRLVPEGSVRQMCELALYIILWVGMSGAGAWFVRDELKINNEQLFTFLSVWLLANVIFAVLVKVLPDGVFKRICGWTFFAVVLVPPLWLCFRIIESDRYQRYILRGFWRAIHR